MHVKIEQNNTAIEEVNGAVIAKLYQLAKRNVNGLDNSSNLVGRLHTTATYQEYIDLLTQKYQDLYINADKYYIHFDDSEVQRILANVIGDGIGVSSVDAAGLTGMDLEQTYNQPLKNNTTITSFNELSKFTNVTELHSSEFYGCTNLTSIDLSKIRTVGDSTFKNCSSLGLNQDLVITLDQDGKINQRQNAGGSGCPEAFYGTAYRTVTVSGNVTQLFGFASRYGTFEQMPNVTKMDFSNTKIQYIGTIRGCANLTTVILPDTLITTDWNAFEGNIQYFIILATTPPTANDVRYWKAYNGTTLCYVPDAALNTYQSATGWSNFSDKIKPISQLPSGILS